MNKRTGLLLSASSLLLALTLVAACTTTADTQSAPVALPTDPPPQEPRSLTAAELMAVDEFDSQQQVIAVEWDQLRTDFDRWRGTLAPCDESAVQDALREFVVDFNAVTEQARDLPRASVTREMAETLIEAAESEEAAFRLLQERWNPNAPSLFEGVEQRRTEAARAQRTVVDLIADSREKLEEAADPERLQAIEEFSEELKAVSDAWDDLHDEYAGLLRESAALDDLTLLARLDGLIQRLNSVTESINGLPETRVTEDMVDALEEAAGDEREALVGIHSAVVPDKPEEPVNRDEPGAAAASEPDLAIAPLHSALESAVERSQDALREIDLEIDEALDATALEDLENLQEFEAKYLALLPDWDAFHERYNEWRRTEGGCSRAEALQALGEFNVRMTEISRQVRDLPQAGYLLPMYNLLVEAAEREEGAMRALRNSWQPFTVDAFIAAERERDNADRLRREAGIALEELRGRS